MISNMKKGEQFTMDETSCGPLCQHPACWQSNTRREKGFPKMVQRVQPVPDIDLDLPTVKVMNMLEDYGDDPGDKYPARFAGKPQHERTNIMLTDVRPSSIKMTRVPQTSPKSTNDQPLTGKPRPAFKFVEVQEVFDPEDLQATWDDTFLPKKYYVWVPNKKKSRRKRKIAKSHESGGNNQHVRYKDVTEDMVPKDVENERLMAKKKVSQLTKSPSYRHYPSMTPRTARSPSRMEYDPEGLRSTLSSKLSVPLSRSGLMYASISELLDLPRDILVQVLDHTKQSDLMSREKIREIIQRFMPLSADRGTSLTSTDLLQPKKLNLHQGNKNVRQPHLMETKPVFYLDDDVVDEASQEDYDSEAYGSLKDLYFAAGAAEPPDLRKYKKPLPSITGQSRAVSAGDAPGPKIPSISLGLPELPSGIRHTRPFTYSRKMEYDFTLEPAPRMHLLRLLSRITSSGEGFLPTRSPSMNVATCNTKTKTPPTSRESHMPSETISEPVPSPWARRPSIFVEEGSIVIPHGEVFLTEGRSKKDDLPALKQAWKIPPPAPVPTPPTSIRSTGTPASEHGTFVRANVPSDATGRSEAGSSVKQSPRTAGEAGKSRPQVVQELSLLQGVSPTFSAHVPKTPVTTPAVKSPKSVPMGRDLSTTTMTETPQDWPPAEKMGSPVHIRAPVNTPGSMMNQDTGLGTIKETGQDYSDQPLPISRGRSVRFEIPEVPPPPSSPQESEEGGIPGEQSRNTVTVNTAVPKGTPSVSNNRTSGVPTIPTDQNTVNTNLSRDNSIAKSGKSKTGKRDRELSMVSSPEPWPQVIEADYDITPNPKSDSTLHMASSGVKTSESDEGNQSGNAVREIKVEITRYKPEQEEPTSQFVNPASQFVNKDAEPVSKVKKMIEESRKVESPAPPPPSPEVKDTEKGRNAPMGNVGRQSVFDEDEPSMTVMQIQPKGVNRKLPKQRQLDTFVNIDIPAVHASEPPITDIKYEENGVIMEESEQEVEESKHEVSESVQSTLANRTISEADTEAVSSVVEPAISQASQEPAVSEDFSEKQDKAQSQQLFADWTSVVADSDADTQAMSRSDKQDLDMTEDGGDHDGFKEDLKKEYEKLEEETKHIEDDSVDKEDTENKICDKIHDSSPNKES